MKPNFKINLPSALRCIDDMWKREFKRLHNKHPLRYGHCSILEQAKETSPEDYERKSIISILCTEKQEWSYFLNEIHVDSADKALWSFLILLLLYRSPSGYDISRDALLESFNILSEDLKSTDKEKIPELVLARMISNDNQGDPDDPLSVFFEPSYDIVVNFIEATVIRVLKKLASWAMAPYEVLEHKFDENNFRDFFIESRYEFDENELKESKENVDADFFVESRYESDRYYEILPRACYNTLVMDELSNWNKKGSFWNFLELKIQGMYCNVNSYNPKGDFVGLKSNNSGYFKNGSILWKELNGREILRTRFEARLICAECGGMLQYYVLEPLSLDAPLNDEEDSNCTPLQAISFEGKNETGSNVLTGERNNDKNWYWIHKITCSCKEQSNPNAFFLVCYEDYMYFSDMKNKEPYQKRECVQCEECTEKYQSKIDKNKRCVWPANKDNKCGVCGSRFAGRSQTISVPVNSYVPSYASDLQNAKEGVDPSLALPVCVFLKDNYPVGENFDETVRKISEKKDEFENALSSFHKSWKIRESACEFKKTVKAILINQEFYRYCFPGEQVDDLASLRKLFETFWESDYPVKNALGSAVKERTQEYVENQFLRIEQN